jgi:asparagine synthase (glutamine-hydrolysing)
MLATLAHRGPDDEGQEWIDHGGWSFGLGNRRLAILDLSAAGHQPMWLGSSALAYNGEVYNFRELRRELESAGQQFHTGTDTEIVLRLLTLEGTAGLRRLNGMYGLAFWDGERKELVVARDKFGIKPLYYHWDGHRLVYASEYKALLDAKVSPSLNERALAGYLSFGWVPGSETLLVGVRELEPGCLIRLTDGEFRIERFDDVADGPSLDVDAVAAARELRDRLRDAVRRQMIADVPVGVLLSGGLDSSAIASYAAEHSSKEVRAYTISFRDEDAKTEQSADDLKFSKLIAQNFGLDLQEFEIGPEIADLMPEVAWHLDDPIADPAAILTLIICRAARPDVKVLLSGQGSDEIFGGYRIHMFDRIARRLAPMPEPVLSGSVAALRGMAHAAGKLPGKSQGLLLAAHRASSAIVDHAKLPAEDRYLAYRGAYHYSRDCLASLLTPAAYEHVAGVDPSSAHRDAFKGSKKTSFFDRMLYVDLKTFLLNQNLVYSDRLSMAASVELRVPFLDDRVADFALDLPPELKVKRLRGKQVLRDAVAGDVPAEVIRRRKAGFGAPIRKWLRADLRPLLLDSLSDSWLERTGLFDAPAVRRLIAEHTDGSHDHTYRLWTLLAFSIWHQRYLA